MRAAVDFIRSARARARAARWLLAAGCASSASAAPVAFQPSRESPLFSTVAACRRFSPSVYIYILCVFNVRCCWFLIIDLISQVLLPDRCVNHLIVFCYFIMTKEWQFCRPAQHYEAIKRLGDISLPTHSLF